MPNRSAASRSATRRAPARRGAQSVGRGHGPSHGTPGPAPRVDRLRGRLSRQTGNVHGGRRLARATTLPSVGCWRSAASRSARP
jgi:hypothetical protein